VNNLPVETESATDRGTLSLGQLCNLPVEDRCAILLRHDLKSLGSVLETLEEVCAGTKMDAERLAWAVAFNIDGLAVLPTDDAGLSRSGSGYRGHWSLDTEWSIMWSLLIKPLAQGTSEPPATLLSELALSVACEHRADWQNPNSRPVNAEAANRMFEIAHSRNREKVVGFCRRYANLSGEPEAIANEAWARVFCDYWSANASRRFLGLCRISTLVCQVARFISIDSIRDKERLISSDEDLANEKNSRFSKYFDMAPGPLDSVLGNQLNSKIRECMSRLPAKARIVAEMVWLRDMNAKRVAQTLRVSEPAISQHLKKARDIVGMCLREQGFNLPS
jgi:RNA polymerase sigma factor (sigma-70 family)